MIKNEEDGIYYWGITSTDGKKTFLKDGEGKMMPVTAAAPKIRINTNTKEWEISTDGGKTWELPVFTRPEKEREIPLFLVELVRMMIMRIYSERWHNIKVVEI